MGLIYIATVARDAGHPVRILFGEDPTDDILDAMPSGWAGLLGYYTTSDNIRQVLRSAAAVKRRHPDVTIAVGGPHANALHRDLIARHPQLDAAGRGDGEDLVVELLAAIEGRGRMEDILGLTFRGADGQPVVNPDRPPLRDLDRLPIPDRDLHPEVPGWIRSEIVTSRGCGQRCAFCYEARNRNYRAHSPRRVVDEIKALHDRHGTRYFCFVDDVFTSNPRRLEALCELMATELRPHRDFFFYCEARVDALTRHPDMLPMLRDAGLIRLQIGSESGVQRIIDAYRKNITLDQVRSVVRRCAEVNVLSVFTNFIIGGAFETEETLDATTAFAEELLGLAPGRIEMNTTFLSPYPGTDVHDRPEAFGLRMIDPEFVTGVSDEYIFVETEALSRQRILEANAAFKRRIDQIMAEQLRVMDAALIRAHLEATNVGMLSMWGRLLRRDPILGAHASFAALPGYHTRLPADAARQAPDIVPLRTWAMTQLRDGSALWEIRRRHITLGRFEQFVLELCGGKLSLAEILGLAERYWGHSVDPDVLATDLIRFLDELADNFLVVFRFQGGRAS